MTERIKVGKNEENAIEAGVIYGLIALESRALKSRVCRYMMLRLGSYSTARHLEG